MGALGTVTLGSIRLQAMQRADMVNSQFIPVCEMNQYISQSYKELYDLLVTSYGSRYYLAQPYIFSAAVGGSIQGQGTLFPLPDGVTTFSINPQTGLPSTTAAPPFYKGLGVDMQSGAPANPANWVTVDRFVFNERNRYGYLGAGQAGYSYGIYQLKYSYEGSNLWLTPIPASNLYIQLWYIPEPTNLQVNLPVTTTINSGVLTLSDTSQLAVGMSAQVLGVQPATYTITALTATTITLSGYTAAVSGSAIFSFWSDTTTFDGISGWEDFVVVSAAIKAMNKQEGDTSALGAEMAGIRERIITTAADRDIGKPSHASPPTDRNIQGLWRGRGWE
jgi:hypothetical protein